jgi:hypothetical protein
MAVVFAGRGFDVFIDDVMIPPTTLDHYKPFIPRDKMSCFLLNPSTETIASRLHARMDIFDQSFIEKLPSIYNWLNSHKLQEWDVIDSSGLSISETCQVVLSRLNLDACDVQ